ncbi:17789_t:CDS:1 [Dentiscutata erythropus]|uniref:17789_t:CDS:1 n=1 Tax=Dentiscutata erythropus TaxID=1348616 RepID=A0A9N9NYH6_9GLOM|nr:17789_t:CDS:1 [Dentiscutata erythropus]
MSQEIFNNLNNEQKAEIKHIRFCKGDGKLSISNYTLHIYSNHPEFGELKGELDLAPFPNLIKIEFKINIQLNILESIDISKNDKLNKIVITLNPYTLFWNCYFIFLVKKMQINRIIISYNETSGSGTFVANKYLNEQTLMSYLVVEDMKLEDKDKKLRQLEAEVVSLKQTLNENDKVIADLNRQIQQNLTLSQFQEQTNLKQETKEHELKNFNSNVCEQKDDIEKLTTTAKNNASDNLKTILELFLQNNKQMIDLLLENSSKDN